jgi:hypothetical protein
MENNFLKKIYIHSPLLLEMKFCTKTPETFCRFTTMPLLRTKHLNRTRELQLGPWAMGAAVLAEMRRLQWQGRLGKVGTTAWRLTGVQFVAWLGVKGTGEDAQRHGRAAAAGSSAPAMRRPGSKGERVGKLS